MRKSVALFAFAVLAAARVQCQSPSPDVEQVLVPVFNYSLYPFQGLYGAIWQLQLDVANLGIEKLYVSDSWPAPQGCNIGNCPDPAVPPGSVQHLADIGYQNPTKLFYFYRNRSEDLSFSLRLKELSRGQVDLQLPVVREHDYLRSRTAILHVPVNARSRATMRLYDPSGRESGATIRVKIFSEDSNELLADDLVPLFGNPEHFAPLPTEPAYAAIASLRDAYEIASSIAMVRIELEPTESTPVFWGFVSVTDDETLNVSLYTPE